MKIVLCAVDTRLAGAWRRALPGTGGLPPEPAARAMLRGIQDALCPRRPARFNNAKRAEERDRVKHGMEKTILTLEK